jgi:hypothetical protein
VNLDVKQLQRLVLALVAIIVASSLRRFNGQRAIRKMA